MGQGPAAPKASLDAGVTLEPRAAQAVMVPRGRRETPVQKDLGAWPEKSATKELRETVACLDPEAHRGLLGSLGTRDLEETQVMQGHVETQDSRAPRETQADLDSATPDPAGHRARKASQAPGALRVAEATLA